MARMNPPEVPTAFTGATPAAVAAERRDRMVHAGDDGLTDAAYEWCERVGLIDPETGDACCHSALVALRLRSLLGHSEPRRIEAGRLSRAAWQFAADLGLEHVLEREYGERA